MMCRCVDPNIFECLKQRYDVSLSLSQCLKGCSCLCHKAPRGMLITPDTWQANRQKLAALAVPALLSACDEIRDPRIRALMSEAQ
ncbi:MAG TPA: hypothetical protein VHL10_03065 [Nitrososphaera sp.]|jgi:hypothetical protein|nr:hypothetical protein [Nitrososphaera sp.]